MEKISTTELRNNLYKIIDRVIETGRPQEIIRGNHILEITLADSKKKKEKLKNLKPHNTINCDPKDLINIKVSTWEERKNL